MMANNYCCVFDRAKACPGRNTDSLKATSGKGETRHGHTQTGEKTAFYVYTFLMIQKDKF